MHPKRAGGHSNSGVGSNSPYNIMAGRAGAVLLQGRLVLLLRLAAVGVPVGVALALAWGCGVPAAAKEAQREVSSRLEPGARGGESVEQSKTTIKLGNLKLKL